MADPQALDNAGLALLNKLILDVVQVHRVAGEQGDFGDPVPHVPGANHGNVLDRI